MILFLVFSTFLDFYNPLYLLEFVETTILTWKFNQKRIISAAPAPLTTAIAKFGQDYDTLLYVFPKLHLFLDLKSLFHSFEMLTGNLRDFRPPRHDVFRLFPAKNEASENSDLPQLDVRFHLIANFRVDMRERDQSIRILH